MAVTVYRAGTENYPCFSVDDSADKVWLVTDPRLYFPLDQNLRPSTKTPGVKNPTSKVCLWETDVTSLDEDFTLERISDGACHVELNGSSLRDKWKKTSVPQCRGGLSLMDVRPVIQAVIVYMKDHYPTTPEEFNFHAELKAACHWYWLDDTKQHPSRKPVPYDDCRLKIAATYTLVEWKKQLKSLQEEENKRMDVEQLKSLQEEENKGMDVERSDSSDESVDEQLSDLRQGIYVLEKHFGSGSGSCSGSGSGSGSGSDLKFGWDSSLPPRFRQLAEGWLKDGGTWRDMANRITGITESITSSTSQKHRNFVSEPMGEKKVTELAGIDETLGKRLEEKGFDKAYVVLSRFLYLKKDEKMFLDWIKDECGANKKQGGDCYSCLKEWCDAFL